MNEEEIRRYRESIALYGVFLQDMGEVAKGVARALTPTPVRNKIQELMAGIRARTAPNNQASGNPGNSTGTQGQMYINSSRSNGPFGLGLLRSRTPQQPPPQPPNEEQKRQMAEQQKQKASEDKKKLAREKLRRQHGLNIDTN